MQFNVFPSTYASRLRSEASCKAAEMERQSNARIQELETKTRNKPSSPIYQGLGGIMLGGISGLCIGCIVCTVVCAAGLKGADEAAFFICGIIGAIIGAISCYNEQVEINNTYSSSMSSIDCEKRETPPKIKNIYAECERKISEYSSQFEEEAKRLSTTFAESTLATEVIEWMTTGFAKAIDAADRRSHVESIGVPFMFKVYNNKITCNLGTFDFEIKRCRNLESPLEQTALARAIASAIQLNITMKYLKDASGTEIVTNINYSYEADSAVAILTYSAVNGNYRTVQDWAE